MRDLVRNPDPSITSSDLRVRIKDSVEALQNSYLRLGCGLYMVKHRESYVEWGFSTFKDYVETEVGISIRQAERLRQVWTRLVKDIGVRSEEVSEVGFSNALLIMPVINRLNKDRWLGDAKSLSYRELKDAVQKERGVVYEDQDSDTASYASPAVVVSEEPLTDGDEPVADTVDTVTGVSVKKEGNSFDEAVCSGVEKVTTVEEQASLVSFSLFPGQSLVVEEALAKAERVAGSVKRGHLLSLIATDFLSGFVGQDKSETKRLSFHIANLERAMGVKLLAIRNQEASEELEKFLESRPELFGLG